LLAGVELENAPVEEEVAPRPAPVLKLEEVRILADLEADSDAAYDDPLSFNRYNQVYTDSAKEAAIKEKNARQAKAAKAEGIRIATGRTAGKKQKKVKTAEGFMAQQKRGGANLARLHVVSAGQFPHDRL
jgi:type IV secretory pathway VirB10-like protein